MTQVDPNYDPKRAGKYRSGNDGRLHPGLKLHSHYGPKVPYVNEARLAVMQGFVKAVGK